VQHHVVLHQPVQRQLALVVHVDLGGLRGRASGCGRMRGTRGGEWCSARRRRGHIARLPTGRAGAPTSARRCVMWTRHTRGRVRDAGSAERRHARTQTQPPEHRDMHKQTMCSAACM
jgi:hypothetical protein